MDLPIQLPVLKIVIGAILFLIIIGLRIAREYERGVIREHKSPPKIAGACERTFFIYNRRFEMAENTETVDIKQFQLHGKDTGSADVQVALLTRRIGELTEHLKNHAKDHSSRRGLLKMVAQRRSLLDYLSRSQAERYKKLIDKLNLRK